MNKGLAQLPLDFKLRSRQTFGNFISGRNLAAIHALQELNAAVSVPPAPVYLWGESHVGKSHLLNATCQAATEQGGQAAVIPAHFIRERDNLGLSDAFDLVCLDDVHQLAGDADGEQRLFDWINHLRQVGMPFVLASRLAPGDPLWRLPDLVSRLNWGRAWQLLPLNREQALAVFGQRAAERGLKLDETVLKWLRRHQSSDLNFLLQLLEIIDKNSLQTRRKLTIPLLKELIAQLPVADQNPPG